MLSRNRPFHKASPFFTFVLFVFFCFSLHLLHPLTKRPLRKISQQKKAFNLGIPLLQFASFGHYRLLSSLLWIDMWMFSNDEKYQNKDLYSWMYLRLKTITEFEPFFYEAYRFGGTYLAIIKDDIYGAAALYEKGLKHFPDDLQLNLHAAFNYYQQLHNYPRAIELYEKIQGHPKAPPILPVILSRLKANVGHLENAFLIVKILFDATPQESPAKIKLFESLYAIKAELDLKCLNEKKKKCSKFDFEGRAYIYRDGQFVAPRTWKAYRYRPSKKSRTPPIKASISSQE